MKLRTLVTWLVVGVIAAIYFTAIFGHDPAQTPRPRPPIQHREHPRPIQEPRDELHSESRAMLGWPTQHPRRYCRANQRSSGPLNHPGRPLLPQFIILVD